VRKREAIRTLAFYLETAVRAAGGHVSPDIRAEAEATVEAIIEAAAQEAIRQLTEQAEAGE